jgi:anaerobic selenocysteine-containing dehydrogenase
MPTETRRTFCRICEPACGLTATVTDGELVALAPDREHPISRGYACHKGLFALDVHRDPDRLEYPQRRRGDGYERIDWDTAADDVAQRLRAVIARHGPRAVAGYLGNPGEYNSLLSEAWYAFFGQLGTDRLFNVNTQDCGNKFAGAEAVYGSVTIHPVPDFEHTDFVLLIGENPAVSQMSFCSLPDAMGTLKAVARRGGRVVFVNPRRVESADGVGEVVQIRPDTDVYLLAAMLDAIDRGPGFAAAVVASHGRHVEELRAVVRRYAPARVAAVTGIPAETIERLALDFARAPRASVHMSTGVNMGRQGTLAYWLLQMLSFVTGNLDRAGGNVLSVGYYERRARAGRNPTGEVDFIDVGFGPVRKPKLPVFPYPGNLLADFIEDAQEPIRALVVCAGNPLLAMGGEERLRRALPRLELLVVIDLYRNATGEYADYLLPATDAFEREDINGLGLGLQQRPNIQYTAAVVEPRGERRHERWILARLAQALGLVSELDDPAAHDPWGKVAHMLHSRGLSFDDLRTREVIDLGPLQHGRFYTDYLQTADGRVDCCPAVFAQALVRMANIFDELAAEPRGQLKLISKREARMMNSWLANLPQLKTKTNVTNHLYMHPDDAAARGLADGARVLVRNAHGAVEVPLRLSDELLPGVVAMPHGWGQGLTSGMRIAQRTPGANCNRLLPTGAGSFEPLSGQAHMTGVPVEVVAFDTAAAK